MTVVYKTPSKPGTIKKEELVNKRIKRVDFK